MRTILEYEHWLKICIESFNLILIQLHMLLQLCIRKVNGPICLSVEAEFDPV